MLSPPSDSDGGRTPQAGRHDFSASGSTAEQVTLVRLELKIDAMVQMQQMRHESLMSDIKNIREAQLTTSSDHEHRIRNLEQRRYVEPKSMWTAFSLFVAVASVIVAVINTTTR